MQNSNRFSFPRHVAVFALASAIALPVWAQQSQTVRFTDSQQLPASGCAAALPAIDHPLSQPKEGFWGRVNPFASKKWVKRQTDPINDRLIGTG